jgi:hypothetical protein
MGGGSASSRGGGGGGGASGRGGVQHHQRRARRRPSLPVEELCLLEKKKKGRERNGECLTLSSMVENESSVFSPPSTRPSPSITVPFISLSSYSRDHQRNQLSHDGSLPITSAPLGINIEAFLLPTKPPFCFEARLVQARVDGSKPCSSSPQAYG